VQHKEPSTRLSYAASAACNKLPSAFHQVTTLQQLNANYKLYFLSDVLQIDIIVTSTADDKL